MANSYLKKIILEEIRNVLNEQASFPGKTNVIDDTPPPEGTQAAIDIRKKAEQAQGKLPSGKVSFDAPTARAVDTAKKVTTLNAPGATNTDGTNVAQALVPPSSRRGMDVSKLVSTGTKAIAAAKAQNPIGRLQTSLAKLGHKISNSPDNAPDSQIGPLTIQALKKETGKTYSPQYVANNINQINTEIAKAVAAKSGIIPGLKRAAADIEKLNVDIPQQKSATTSKTPSAPTTTAPKASDDLSKKMDVKPLNLEPKKQAVTVVRREPEPTYDFADNEATPGLRTDPTGMPLPQGSPQQVKSATPSRNVKKESLRRDLARMLKNL